ncbi:MAG: ribonuclease H family protein [Anaerolineales bacterium]
MAAQKFYVVWAGRETGVFTRWSDCARQVTGFAGARYKSFATLREAEQAFRDGAEAHVRMAAPREAAPAAKRTGAPIAESYCVDASCPGNPGPVEYQCVRTATGEKIFHQGPLAGGSNNIGEFLAIVHALAMMQKNGETLPIYSDSRIAATWVRAKKCRTKIARHKYNRPLFELVERAEAWLAANSYPNKILKWDTVHWGEIPADFGRK